MDRTVSTQALGARRPAPPGNVRSSSSRLPSSQSIVRSLSGSSDSGSGAGTSASGAETRANRRSSRSLLESPELEYNRSASSPTSPSLGSFSGSGLPRSESITSSSGAGPSLLVPSSPARGMDLTERSRSRASSAHSGSGAPSAPSSPNRVAAAMLSPPPPARARADSAGSAPGEISLDDLRNALEGVSRDDLLIALGRTKQQIDQADAEREEHLLQIETLQAQLSDWGERFASGRSESGALHAQIAMQEEKMEEMAKDQERLEDELYSKTGVVDRLRKQLEESEKSRAEAERRYADQSTTLDKERQYYSDAQALVKSQKANVQSQLDKLAKQNSQLMRENERMLNQLSKLKAKPEVSAAADAHAEQGGEDTEAGGRPNADASTGSTAEDDDHASPNSAFDERQSSSRRTMQDEAEAAQLREELESTQRSHASLQQTMQLLQMEIKELKNGNKELREQSETLQSVLEERTLSGSLLKNSALLRGAGALAAATPSENSSFNDGDSEADGDGDERDRETDNTSLSIDDVDDVDDLPVTPKSVASGSAKKNRRRSAAVRTGRDGRQEISTEGGLLSPLPTDLASELDHADDGQDEAGADGNAEAQKARNAEKRRKRSGELSKDVKELQDEVLSLRDANKGLTLYVSKILDRIIAREGYENILAVDPEGKRTMRGGLGSTMGRNRSKRTSILPINKSSDGDQGGADFYQPPGARGSYIRGPNPPAAADNAQRSGSRRTASVDWRGLLPSAIVGTSSGAQSNAATQSNFRPLALQSISASRTASAASSAARKVESHEEMEDDLDLAERERIRASLQLEGIVTPAHQLRQGPNSPSINSSPLPSTGSGAAGSRASSSAWGGFFARVLPTATSPNPSATSPQMEARGSSSGSAGFMSPRLTTFDDPAPARPQSGGGGGGAAKREQALQATQAGASGAGLTDVPARGLAARRAVSKASSAGDASFASRAGSVAGDESYAQDAPSPSAVTPNEEEPGWKKALKRVSLLASSVPAASTGA